MFVQVIRGKAKDPAGLRKQSDKWKEELRPGADGFLGSTSGITDDGEFIALARFESDDAARRNSDRPEQGAWWEETSRYLESPTFADCHNVVEWGRGGSDDAGFVQVMQYRTTNAKRMMEMATETDAEMRSFRPDIIGGYSADHGDGNFTDVIYFTSETEARAGEKKSMPDNIQAMMDEWGTITSDMTYLDLREPWLVG